MADTHEGAKEFAPPVFYVIECEAWNVPTVVEADDVGDTVQFVIEHRTNRSKEIRIRPAVKAIKRPREVR